jgi:hypothetical protein
LVYDSLMKKSISRYQFSIARVVSGVLLAIFFGSLLFNPLHYGLWQGVFPVQAMDESIFSFLNVLNQIPVTIVLVFSAIMSLVLAVGWQRRFVASTILLGIGILHHQKILMVSPVSLLLLVLVLMMMMAPLGEEGTSTWKLPSGIFVLAHSLMVFFYVVLFKSIYNRGAIAPRKRFTFRTLSNALFLSWYFDLGLTFKAICLLVFCSGLADLIHIDYRGYEIINVDFSIDDPRH